MQRSLAPFIREDLSRKIILISGPRQTGKTTLARMLGDRYDYLNFDVPEHRLSLVEQSWDRRKGYVIFDELHKMRKWKVFLKGIYDGEGLSPGIVVTGSAKLNTYRKVGDSLAGRFFLFRLHPLDLHELAEQRQVQAGIEVTLDRLLNVGGFPEPFLHGTERFYHRWRRSHLDVILRQDLPALEHVQEITAIETLVQLLRKRVGSPISYSSLSRDLQCSDKTVKRWLSLLESVYVIFKVSPHHRNIARSLTKAPKYYFFDTGLVIGDQGVRLENLVAGALLKRVQFAQDCLGKDLDLFYVRDKDGREVDFLVTLDEQPQMLIEVKWSDDAPAPAIAHFAPLLGVKRAVQLVRHLSRDKTFPTGLEIRHAATWLSEIPLDT